LARRAVYLCKVPVDDVNNQEEMIAYYKGWRPSYVAGNYRFYSNPSIACLAYLLPEACELF